MGKFSVRRLRRYLEGGGRRASRASFTPGLQIKPFSYVWSSYGMVWHKWHGMHPIRI